LNTEGEVTVHGEILLPPEDPPERIGRVVARIEDVSQADAPAVTVAAQVQEMVAVPAGERRLPYEIRLPAERLDPARRYTVRVHLDVSGTGDVSPGDYVSTASTAVPANTSEIPIPVRRVS
jgi:uncharacterized lipoprotein YbaY